jgi:tetratricopeptide (TPR) repeat protein
LNMPLYITKSNCSIVARIMAIIVGLFLFCMYPELLLCQEAAAPQENAATNPYLDKGAQYFQNGQYQDAIGQLQMAIQSNPEDALAYSLLGSAYLLLGKESQGSENIQKAVELYKKSGDYQKADKLVSLLANYSASKDKAIDEQVKLNLKIIQLTERILRSEKNSYVSCDSTQDCNSKLDIKLPADSWEYTVFSDDKDSFCSEAKEINRGAVWIIKESGDPVKGTCE